MAYEAPPRDPKGWRQPEVVEKHDDGSRTLNMSFWHSGDADEPRYYYRLKVQLHPKERGQFSPKIEGAKPSPNWPFLQKIMGWS